MTEREISLPGAVKVPEEWRNENHRDKMTRRLSWLMQERRARYDEVIEKMEENNGSVSLVAFFTSGNPETYRYAHMLDVSLESLTAEAFVTKEDLFSSGERQQY